MVSKLLIFLELTTNNLGQLFLACIRSEIVYERITSHRGFHARLYFFDGASRYRLWMVQQVNVKLEKFLYNLVEVSLQ